MRPEMWNPKRRTGDWYQRVYAKTVKPAGWRVQVRVWPAKSQLLGLWDVPGTEPTRFCGPNPDRWLVTRTHG